MIKRLYPGGKAKAFNTSYDDGVLQDLRFVQMLNRSGLKGTFNLNSALMQQEFEWVHESGMTVKRLSADAARKLYQGHEVASHTSTHPYMHDLTEAQILSEMWSDRYHLEKLLGQEVSGFAVPFTYYSPLIAACAENVGFEYARISEETNCYIPPEDYYWWRGGKFHWDGDLDDYVEGFLATDEELALCQIVGHSYDLDVMRMWDKMERIFEKIQNAADVLPMTNIELVRYLKAMRKTVITGSTLRNTSSVDLWFEIDGKITVVHPGEEILY